MIGIRFIHNNNCYPQQEEEAKQQAAKQHQVYPPTEIPFSQQQLVSLVSTTMIGIFVIHNTNWYLCYPQQQLLSTTCSTTGSTTTSGSLLPAMIFSPVDVWAQKQVRNKPIIPEVSFQLPITK